MKKVCLAHKKESRIPPLLWPKLKTQSDDVMLAMMKGEGGKGGDIPTFKDARAILAALVTL